VPAIAIVGVGPPLSLGSVPCSVNGSAPLSPVALNGHALVKMLPPPLVSVVAGPTPQSE
jgi:hypothetical protein